MADTYKPLLKSIIAKIKATTSLTAYVGSGASSRVYTNVPQDTTFPYIRVNITSEPFDTVDTSGMVHHVTVQCFSRKPGPEEAAAMRAAVYALLHRNESAFTLDNGTLFNINYDNVGFVEQEPDGKTWQGFAQFRAVVMD